MMCVYMCVCVWYVHVCGVCYACVNISVVYVCMCMMCVYMHVCMLHTCMKCVCYTCVSVVYACMCVYVCSVCVCSCVCNGMYVQVCLPMHRCVEASSRCWVPFSFSILFLRQCHTLRQDLTEPKAHCFV